MDRKGGWGLTGVLRRKRGSRWPEKRTLDAGGPGARGMLGEARRSAVNTVEAVALAGEISRRRRGAAAVARTPASLSLLYTAPKEGERPSQRAQEREEEMEAEKGRRRALL